MQPFFCPLYNTSLGRKRQTRKTEQEKETQRFALQASSGFVFCINLVTTHLIMWSYSNRTLLCSNGTLIMWSYWNRALLCSNGVFRKYLIKYTAFFWLSHCNKEDRPVLYFFAVVTCPAMNSPSHGSINSSANTFQSVLRFTCNQGYRRTGPERRTCQADGTWSGKRTSCSGKFLVLICSSKVTDELLLCVFGSFKAGHPFNKNWNFLFHCVLTISLKFYTS